MNFFGGGQPEPKGPEPVFAGTLLSRIPKKDKMDVLFYLLFCISMRISRTPFIYIHSVDSSFHTIYLSRTTTNPKIDQT